MTRSQHTQVNDNMKTSWQSTNSPVTMSQCVDGRGITRTEISLPPGLPCETLVRDERCPSPPGLRQEVPSNSADRRPIELENCFRCGGSRPSDRRRTSSHAVLMPERREKQQLLQASTRPSSDLSRQKNPRCTTCFTAAVATEVKERDREERYSGPRVPLKTSREPVNTSTYQRSTTASDFTSPATSPPWTRTKGNRRSFYDRFLSDMCRLCSLAESIPDPGSLGGEISQYQVDFEEREPRKLGGLYSLPEHSRSAISDAASAYAVCHRICNF